MKIKKLGALLVSAALCAGMAAPAFAFEGEAAPVEQPVLPEVVEEDVVTITDETSGALTPEGNLTLVDDYHTDYSDGSGQQFITLVSKSGSFNELFNKQLKILIETSDKADTKLADLQKRYEGIRVDTFLKDASFIIEKLETAAVDINRIFNPDAEEDLWKKYYNGDTAAFVRHLSRTMSKSQILSIRSEFEKNLEFRNIVTKYLSEFETLVSKARENERSGILLSVISGADIGKLYYILARSLDKLN